MFSGRGWGGGGGVLISILIGYALINFKYTKTINLPEICNHILPMFCRDIEIGNYLYDCNGAFGFLHVEEGINSFSELMNLRIVNKFNLHLSSDQEYSLMLHRHQKIKISPKQFSVIIVNAMTFSLISVKNNVLLLNSHNSDPYSDKVSIVHFDLFIRLKLVELNYSDVKLVYDCLIVCI